MKILLHRILDYYILELQVDEYTREFKDTYKTKITYSEIPIIEDHDTRDYYQVRDYILNNNIDIYILISEPIFNLTKKE